MGTQVESWRKREPPGNDVTIDLIGVDFSRYWTRRTHGLAVSRELGIAGDPSLGEQGRDLGGVFVKAGDGEAVVSHVEHEISPHDTEADHPNVGSEF